MKPVDISEFLEPTFWLTQNGGPRYLQLRKQLRLAITSGVLPPDAPLPPEREIASITNLSRVTVRKAVETLVEEGLIVQRRGSGSYVGPSIKKVEQSLSRLTSFTEDMERRALEVNSTWLERGLFHPTEEEVSALNLAKNESVARVCRLRQAADTPLAIERASLSTKYLPNPLLVETSLYEVLGRYGNKPVRAIQRISATNLRARDAELLNVQDGAAGLKIQRTSFLASGETVEFTQSIYRGDKYDFVAELKLSEE